MDRIAGDEALQAQIDAIDPDGDSDVDWSDIENKPATFPPSAHTHQIGDVSGLQDALDNLEDSITDGGGFVDAPNDGRLYGRQSEAWAEVVIPEQTDPAWDSITGKPSEYPPAAHNHDGVYQPVGDYLTDAPNDGAQYVRQSQAWAEVSIPEAGAAVQIGATFDGTPKEGDQWLETPAGGEAVMWIYDGEKWLQMPGGGAGQITTASLILDHPTRSGLPEGAETQADANYFFTAALSKVVTPEGEPIGPDLNDYYTSLEADEKFQPKGDYIEDAPNDNEEYARKNQGWVKLQGHNYTGADAVKLTGDQSVAGHKTWTGVATFGDTVTMRGSINGDDTANFQNAVTAGSFVKAGGTASQFLCADGSVADKDSLDYIEDAPSDGELYVRKDGKWEPYTPSSGGGANMIEPIIQPASFGVFLAGNYAAVYEAQNVQPGEVTCQVPDGFSFLMVDFTAGTGVIPTSGIYFDDVPVFQNFPAELKQDRLLFGDQPGKPLYVVKNELKFTITKTGFAKITGYFVPSDNTTASAELREAYLAEEAERIAAMPQPEPEVGTQEIPDE